MWIQNGGNLALHCTYGYTTITGLYALPYVPIFLIYARYSLNLGTEWLAMLTVLERVKLIVNRDK